MELIKQWTNLGIEAGCDEVGRGCLAGPVVAASVIIDENFHHPLINDSKKLTPKKRKELDHYIRENAVDFAIAEVSPVYIDEHNILNASIHAMHLALDQLNIRPNVILVDGNRFKPYKDIPHECIIKGDSKALAIAAASILAKNYRDNLMARLHTEFPHYGWDRNAGYPTKLHRMGIMEYGITSYHRISFRLLKEEGESL